MGKKFEVFDPKQWKNSIVFKVVSSHEEQLVVDSEEMHENTEEIDALLYSESNEIHEQYEQQDEHEASNTCHSPLDYQFVTSKRRRLDTELMDTASSRAREDDESSSCIGEEQEWNKRSKRKRIQDTVEVLRRIIPGLGLAGVNGKAKDAATVLDEAIRYLKSLKLRMKGFQFITN